jgi:hypothetical protein
MMKKQSGLKLAVILCLILSLGFIASCSSNSTHPIVGKWLDSQNQASMEFTANGKFIIEAQDQLITGDYELIGDNIIKIKMEGLVGAALSLFGGNSIKYDITGDTLTIVIAGETVYLTKVGTQAQVKQTPVSVQNSQIDNFPFLSQYQGQSTENYDCGPAAVAMVVQYFGKRPSGIPDTLFLTQIRAASGNFEESNTDFYDLENALAAFGLDDAVIPNSLSPQPDTQIQTMKAAIAHKYPVIALLCGADLGRVTEDGYGDHWVVLTGFSKDGKYVYINDPDTQSAKSKDWIKGGNIRLSISTFKNAVYNAARGPYGIVVSNVTITSFTNVDTQPSVTSTFINPVTTTYANPVTTSYQTQK